MRIAVSIYTLLCLLSWPNIGLAQNKKQSDTTIKGATIEIIQSYKPEVQKAEKPKVDYELPKANSKSLPNLQYEVEDIGLQYHYKSVPIKPLMLNEHVLDKGYSTFIKAAGGNQSTLFLDAGTSAWEGQNFKTNFYAYHHSQNGQIENQQHGRTGIEFNGEVYTKSNIWKTDIGLQNRTFRSYGYSFDSAHIVEDDQLINSYNSLYAQLGLESIQKNLPGTWEYQLTARGSNYLYNNLTSETGILSTGHLLRNISKDMQLGVTAAVNMLQYRFNGDGQANNLLYLGPQFNYYTDNIRFKAQLSGALGHNNMGYILPDFSFSFVPDKKWLKINLGYKHEVLNNHFEWLSKQNPYMHILYTVRHSLRSTLFVGASASVGHHLFFDVLYNRHNYNNFAYYNNMSQPYQYVYAVNYFEGVKMNTLDILAKYQIADNFVARIALQTIGIAEAPESEIPYLPRFRMRTDAQYTYNNKFKFGAYLDVINQIHFIDSTYSTLAYSKTNGVVDFGLSAEYKFVDQLSGFININNFLGRENELYYLYPSYGFNIFAGLLVKF